MKIVNIDVFSFTTEKEVKIDNRIPTGKGIEDDNTIAMNSTTYDLIVDFSWP